MRLVMLLHVDDVVAKVCLHQIAGLTRFQSEGSLFKRRDHLAPGKYTKLTAAGLAARVIGVLLRQFRKVSTRLQLLQHVLCLGLRGGVGLGVRALRLCNQNVTPLYLLLHLILALVGRRSRSAVQRQ